MFEKFLQFLKYNSSSSTIEKTLHSFTFWQNFGSYFHSTLTKNVPRHPKCHIECPHPMCHGEAPSIPWNSLSRSILRALTPYPSNEVPRPYISSHILNGWQRSICLIQVPQLHIYNTPRKYQDISFPPQSSIFFQDNPKDYVESSPTQQFPSNWGSLGDALFIVSLFWLSHN